LNAGLTSDEMRLLLDLKKKANDDQVKAIRGIFEGEWKERQVISQLKPRLDLSQVTKRDEGRVDLSKVAR